MNIKRILTTLIGIPIVGVILVLGNQYLIGFLIMLLGIICTYEYYIVIDKVAHPIKWVGYISTAIIALVSIFPIQTTMQIILFGIPTIVLILFLKVIITNMNTTFKDVAYTFLGIFYITIFTMFLTLIRTLDNGKILLGYVVIIAWATDIFAYLIGKNFGKHFFSKVSPKKTIEGCIAGILGAVVIGLIYTVIADNYWNIQVNSYLMVAGITILLSIISQVGDFVASSIKRFVDLKDYGDLLPGHGGMLDRIDSLIFIAPFAYLFFTLLV